MTTNEAARKVGVPTRQLLRWQSEGWLTPGSNGRGDQGRRLEWSDKDVEQAKAMKNQESHKSASEAIIDSLGGQDFFISLGRARAQQDKLTPEQVVVCGPRGARIVRRDGRISNAVDLVGCPAIVLSYEGAI